jgi:hypothetical protein
MDNSKSNGNLDSGDNSETSTEGTNIGQNTAAPEGNGVPEAAVPEAAVPDAAVPDPAVPGAAGETPSAALPPAYGAPGAPTTPPAQHSAQPTVVTRASGLIRAVPAERYIAAAVGAVVVYAAGWVLSLVFTLLAFVAAADESLDWGLAFAAPAQIVGMAVAGILTVSATVMGISASVALLWLPLLVTTFLIVALAIVARRDERLAPSATRGIRWLLSAVSGLVLAVLVLVIAAVTPLRYAVGDGSDTGFGIVSGSGSASSASVTAFLGALVLGTLVSYLARARVARRISGVSVTVVPRAATSVTAAVRSTVPVVSLYLAVVVALVAGGLLIWAVVNGGVDALLTAFFWLPTLVVDGVGLVNLAPVTLSGGLGALAALAGSESSLWMPAFLPGWVTVLVSIVNLLLILAAGILLRLRRAQLMLSPAVSWLTTILTFAVAGIVISIVGGIGMWTSLDTAGLGDNGLLGGIGSMLEGAAAASGTIGLAAWTFLVFAALGALVETVAVFAAPALVQALPAGALGRVGRVTAFAGVPFAMPGAIVAPAQADAGGPVNAAAAEGAIAEDGTAGVDGAKPASDGSPTAAIGAATVPMSPEKKRRVRLVLAVVGGGVVVVLGASIAVSIVNQVVYSPQHQVESFLDAVIAKDASAALAIGAVGASSGEPLLLTDAVLEATDGGISGYTVTEVKTTGDYSVVTVDVEQGEQTEEMTYTVGKTGTTALVFDQWTLDPVYLPSLAMSISPGITELDVNGVTVTPTAEELEAGYLQYPAFAGEYVVGSGGDDPWLTAKPQTVQVGVLKQGDTADLVLEPTEKFTTSVDAQIAEYLDACVAQKSLRADKCPIYAYDFGTVTDVVWTIDDPAVIDLGSSFRGEWYVSTEDRGSATVTYTKTSYSGTATQETETVSFSITGTVTLKDGAPVFKGGY